MSTWKPIDPGLPPSRRELAEQLRALQEGSGLTLTSCAARLHLDKSVVSRYLAGERIPPPEFVDRLAALVGERLGVPVTATTIEHLAELRRRALEQDAERSPHSRVQLLQEHLAAAESRAEQAVSAQRSAEQELRRAHQRADELDRLLRDPDNGASEPTEQQGPDAPALYERVLLQQERIRLTRHIEVLRREASAAGERAVQAERDRDRVLVALLAAEQAAADAFTLPSGPGAPTPPGPQTPVGRGRGRVPARRAGVWDDNPAPEPVATALAAFVLVAGFLWIAARLVVGHPTAGVPPVAVHLASGPGGNLTSIGGFGHTTPRLRLGVWQYLVTAAVAGLLPGTCTGLLLVGPDAWRRAAVGLGVGVLYVAGFASGGVLRLGALIPLGVAAVLVFLLLVVLAALLYSSLIALVPGGEEVVPEIWGFGGRMLLAAAMVLAEAVLVLAEAAATRERSAAALAVGIGALAGIAFGLWITALNGLGTGAALALGIGALTGAALPHAAMRAPIRQR